MRFIELIARRLIAELTIALKFLAVAYCKRNGTKTPRRLIANVDVWSAAPSHSLIDGGKQNIAGTRQQVGRKIKVVYTQRTQSVIESVCEESLLVTLHCS